MKKTFKIIATLTGVVLALLLAIIVIVPLVFNPNDHKDEITALVKQETGRELQIRDEIELSLFPWIGFSIGAVELSNAQGFDGEAFATIDRAEIKVKLLPLLSRQIEASTVILNGLRLNLIVASDGATNWDLSGKPTPSTDTDSTPAAAPTAAAAPAGAGLAALAIGGLQITDAQVNYVDHSNNTHYAIKQLTLESGPLSMGTPLDVTLSTQFEASQPQLSGQLNLATRILADLNSERYRFDATRLNTTLRGSNLPGGEAMIDFAADIALDLKQQTASLKALQLNSYGIALSGAVNLQQLLSDVTYRGELRIAEFNPRTVMPALQIELPQTADTTALSKVALAFQLDGTASQYNLQKLALTLDQSRIDGEMKVTLSDAPMPALRYALAIDQIDLDRYLPPADTTATSDAGTMTTPAPVTAGSAAAGAAAETVPLQTLRDLDLNGHLKIGKLKVSGVNMSEVDTELKAHDGVIRLHPLTAQLYQGSYKGDIKLDARGKQLKIALNELMQQIQIEPLLKDYMGEDMIRGAGTIEANLTATGDNANTVTRSLNGTARVALVNGAIKDINIVQMVSEAKAKIKGRPVPPKTAEMRDTDFAEMKASFKIKNGIANNSDLTIKSPFLRVGGSGDINLVNESLDYLAKIVISKTEQGQGGAELDELRGLELPLHVTGTFAAPNYKVELGDVLKQQAKQALDKEKTRLKARLEQQKAEEKAAQQQKIEAEKARLKREHEEKAKEKLRNLFER